MKKFIALMLAVPLLALTGCKSDQKDMSGAEFQTSLEKELYDLCGGSDKPVETLVHEAYMRMN